MKKIILIVCLFIMLVQSLLGQQKIVVGLTYQPYMYENYNKIDWNNEPYSYPIDSYGDAFGISIDKKFSKVLSFESSFLYSVENQKHSSTNTGITFDGKDTYVYNRVISSIFNKLRLKLGLSAQVEIGFNSNLFLSIVGGVQISYLSHYNNSDRTYFVDSNYVVQFDILVNEILSTEERSQQTIWDVPADRDNFRFSDRESDMFFNDWLFGSYTEMAIKKLLWKNYFVKIGILAEYDFTKTNGSNFYSYIGRRSVGSDDWHNIRYGLLFSVLYMFEY